MASPNDHGPPTKPEYSEGYDAETVLFRLLNMESLVSVEVTEEVRSYLRAYLTYGRRDSEILLGYSRIYFPLIEYNLQLMGLPDELKYLPVIESSLRPYAVSTAGAAGLWQLRRSLATHYGLEVDYYLDERRDPHKSTEVALQYLSRLYDRFGSWELALAAYNCGPTRLSRVIRQAGTRDFWELRHLLPRETARFIPRFIAATYLMKYHYHHGILPDLKEPALATARPVLVKEALSFSHIADLTGLDQQLIRELNPTFVRQYIPRSNSGQFVFLPEEAGTTLREYLRAGREARSVGVANKSGLWYVVRPGDSLSKIGRQYGCSVYELRQWNGLDSDLILVGQRLKISNRKPDSERA